MPVRCPRCLTVRGPPSSRYLCGGAFPSDVLVRTQAAALGRRDQAIGCLYRVECTRPRRSASRRLTFYDWSAAMIPVWRRSCPEPKRKLSAAQRAAGEQMASARVRTATSSTAGLFLPPPGCCFGNPSGRKTFIPRYCPWSDREGTPSTTNRVNPRVGNLLYAARCSGQTLCPRTRLRYRYRYRRRRPRLAAVARCGDNMGAPFAGVAIETALLAVRHLPRAVHV
jgi:hypothetical protein